MLPTTIYNVVSYSHLYHTKISNSPIFMLSYNGRDMEGSI